MYRTKKIAVVIPAYNEEGRIGKVVNSIPEYVDKIVAVDDSSKDGTVKELKRIKDERLHIISRTVNGGVGAALKDGYKLALSEKADILVKMDGDGQMNPTDLPKLLNKIVDDGCDYSKGNRFASRKMLEGMPTIRLVGSVLLSVMNKFASGYWRVLDPQNGYTAIRGEVLNKINLNRLHDGFFVENSILIELNILNARVCDVPMKAIYGDERSKLAVLRIVFPFIFSFFLGFHRRMYRKYLIATVHPVAIFYYPGAVMLTWGFLFGLYGWYKASILGAAATTGTVMLAVLPLLVGFELVVRAITLDINEEGVMWNI